jgi:hypothetical protein
MRNRFLMLAVAAMLFALTAFAGTPPYLAVAASGDLTYEDPAGFFSLQYPKSWVKRQTGSEMQFLVDKQGSAGVAVSLHIKTMSADQLADDLTRLLADRRDGFAELSRHEEEASDYAVVWADHSYTQGGTVYRGFVAAAARNRIGFALVGWVPKKDYTRYKTLLTNIVTSLRIAEFAEAPPYDEWRSYTSQHFSFRYLPNTYVAKEIKRIARDHEQTYTDIVKQLSIADDEPITLYMYPSEAALYRATARKAGHAINEAGEVHTLWVSANNHQTTGHEMTHVITTRAIGEPSEALLGEGIAVCLDHSGKDYREVAADLLAADKLIPLKDMLGDAWFEADGEVTYPESGSFVCFLLEEYGVARFKQLYTRADILAGLQSVYRTTLTALEKRWLTSLQ